MNGWTIVNFTLDTIAARTGGTYIDAVRIANYLEWETGDMYGVEPGVGE